MSSHVPRNLLLYAAQLHYLFDGSQNRAVFGYGEYLAAFAHALVLLINHFGNVEQLNLRQDRRFLAGDMNPLVIVEIRADIVVREVIQFAIGQAREARKKHQSKGDGNKENQTERVVKQRFCGCLPLQPNSKERQDNASFPLPSHYLSCYQLKAKKQHS